MLRLIAIVLLFVLSLDAATLQEMKQERRVALMIVNDDYAVAPLEGAPQEAEKMHDFLKNTGFDVLMGKNVDKREFIGLLRKFTAKVRSGSVALFYYYGHTVQFDGKNYLIPYEAPIIDARSVRYEALELASVLDKITKMQSRTNIVILEIGFGHPFNDGFAPDKPGLAAVNAQERMSLFITVTPGKTVQSSQLTRRFIKAMGTQGISLSQGADFMNAAAKPGTDASISIDTQNPFYFILPNKVTKKADTTAVTSFG
jgi:hypothetical protein